MVDVAERTRMRGVEEQSAQLADNARVIKAKNTLSEEERKHRIDEINLNKMLYHQQQEQKKAEEALLQQKTGLPEMERKEALPEELQADIRYGFKKSELDQRFRTGKKTADLLEAKRKHNFEMDKIQENSAILEAGNNPTPKKEDDLNKKLSKQEKKARKIFNSPNLSYKDKIRILNVLARGKGIPGVNKDLPNKSQIKRAERLTRKVKQPVRRVLNKALEEKLLKKGARS